MLSQRFLILLGFLVGLLTVGPTGLAALAMEDCGERAMEEEAGHTTTLVEHAARPPSSIVRRIPATLGPTVAPFAPRNPSMILPTPPLLAAASRMAPPAHQRGLNGLGRSLLT